MSNPHEQSGTGEPLGIPGPYVLASILGAELASYRGATGKSQEEVAKGLSCSPSKVFRIESGQSLPNYPTLAAMLVRYGATDETGRLADTLGHIKELRQSLPKHIIDIPPGQRAYEDHEQYAKQVLIYEPHIPDFLLPDSHTKVDRAAGIHSEPRPEWMDAFDARHKTRLLGADGPELCIIVDERSILTYVRRPEGQTQSPTILDGLISHLNAVNTRGQSLSGAPVDSAINPNVSIQVATLEKHGATQLNALQRPAVWMRFPDGTIESRGYFRQARTNMYRLVNPDDSIDLGGTLGVMRIALGERFESTIELLPGPEMTRDIMNTIRESAN